MGVGIGGEVVVGVVCGDDVVVRGCRLMGRGGW